MFTREIVASKDRGRCVIQSVVYIMKEDRSGLTLDCLLAYVFWKSMVWGPCRGFMVSNRR